MPKDDQNPTNPQDDLTNSSQDPQSTQDPQGVTDPTLNPSSTQSDQSSLEDLLGGSGNNLSQPQIVTSEINDDTSNADSAGTNDSGGDTPPDTSHVPAKYGGKKVIATIFSILFIVGAVGVGVSMVQREQLRLSSAWDCGKYIFNVSRQGVVTVENKSDHDEPSQQAKVYINNSLVTTLNVPALDEDESATIGNVSVPSAQGFTWKVDGTKDCDDSGSYPPESTPTPTQTPTPTLTPTPVPSATLTPVPSSTSTPTPTVTPSPTITPTLPPEVTAKCNDVLAYDEDNNLLTQQELSQLTAGDMVKFAVSGQASAGTFTKARFTLNGTSLGETTDKNTNGEFYVEYTIPAGTTSFTVKGEVNHSTLGWI